MWGRARNSLSYLFPLKMLWAIFSDTPIFRILNRTISMYTIPPATVTSTQTFSGAMRDRAETHCKRHLRDFNCSTRKSFLVLSIFFWIHLCCNLNPGSFCGGFLFYSMFCHFLPSCFGLVNDVCFVCVLFNVKLCANSDVQIVTTFQLT
jgi:hypothetical protein